TKVDALAVSIGSEHGFYSHAPRLDYELLEKLHKALQLPLVLHGGSGIPREDVRRAIAGGIRKVNVGTQIRYTYMKSVEEAIRMMEAETQDADIMSEAKKEVKKVLRECIVTCRGEEGAGWR